MNNDFNREIDKLKVQINKIQDNDNKEILNGILEIIKDLSEKNESSLKDIEEYVDSVDRDLSEVKSDVYGIDETLEDSYDDTETKYIEVTCDKCKEVIYMDESLVKSHTKIECPICHQIINK